MEPFAQTLAAPLPVPGAYVPGTAAPEAPASYKNFLASTAGFGQNQVGANTTQANASIADANAAAGTKSRLSDIADRYKELQRLQDPKNYTYKPSKDGGLDFFDAAGKPISVGQYSKITGEDPVKILKNSQNPNDKQYIQDFNRMNTLVEASVQGPEAYKTVLGKIDTELKGTKNPDGTVYTPGSIQKALQGADAHTILGNFRAHYSNIYPDNKPADGGTPALYPDSAPASSVGYSNHNSGGDILTALLEGLKGSTHIRTPFGR